MSTKISLVPVSISKLAAPRVTSTTDLVVVRVSRPHISLLSRPTGTVRARDDGEIGRPGMKLLELLRQRDLEGLLVVSRIFGASSWVRAALAAPSETPLSAPSIHEDINDQ